MNKRMLQLSGRSLLLAAALFGLANIARSEEMITLPTMTVRGSDGDYYIPVFATFDGPSPFRFHFDPPTIRGGLFIGINVTNQTDLDRIARIKACQDAVAQIAAVKVDAWNALDSQIQGLMNTYETAMTDAARTNYLAPLGSVIYAAVGAGPAMNGFMDTVSRAIYQANGNFVGGFANLAHQAANISNGLHILGVHDWQVNANNSCGESQQFTNYTGI